MAVLLRAWFLALFTLEFSCLAISLAQQPDLVVQTGHSTSVVSVAFSPDGKTLASGSGDNTIKLWDAANGREVRTLAGHNDYVTSVTFSPDGHTLASGSSDKTIKLWDVASGRELRTLAPGYKYAVDCVVFSPNGRILASGGWEKVELWDLASGRELRTLVGHTERATSVAFSPDGHILASGSQDKTIKLWDVASGRPLRTLSGHTDSVVSVAYSPDGHILASGSSDKTVKLWDAASGRELQTLKGHTNYVNSVAFSPDGRVLGSGGSDTKIKLWDVASGRELRTLVGHTGTVSSLVFSPDGRTLASGSSDNTIKFWDVASGREVRILAGHSAAVRTLACGLSGRLLAARYADQSIKIWDLTGRGELRPLTGEGGRVGSGVLDTAGRLTSWHYEIAHIKGNVEGETFAVVPGKVGSVAFSPDERVLAWGSSTSATVKLWDVASGGEVQSLVGHKDTVWSIAFSSDGHMLASGSWDGEVKLWDVVSGHELQSLPGHTERVVSVAFSPDGHSLVSASDDQTIKVWDVASGRELRTLASHGGVESLAFSLDGHTVASANLDNTFNLWDVASGRELGANSKHAGQIESIAISPGLDTLASGGEDQTINVWDAASGQQLHTLAGARSAVLAVCFSSNGKYIASGHLNGEVRLWEASTGNQLATLLAIDQSDWVLSDPQGRFDTNNLDEIKGLSWVFPDEPLRALAPEIFMRDYYQPKLLPKLLTGERLPAVRPLSDLNRAQPELELVAVEPEGGGQSVSAVVKVMGTRSKDQRGVNGEYLESGAFDLHLFRDGQLVAQWPEVSETAEKSSARGSPVELDSWRALHEIKLINGEFKHTFHQIRLPRRAGVDKVQFTAYAFNSDRVKSLTTPPFEYSLPKPSNSPSVAGARRAYLISMGVNANRSRWNLNFAVASAQDATRLLHEKLASEYEVVDISLFSALAPDSPQVVLKQATKANLKAVLDLLAGRTIDDALRNAVDPNHRIQPATPDDAVVLFISSHGYADPQGAFYVVPYDTGATLGVTEDLLTRCKAHPEDRSPACLKADTFLEHTISSQEFTAWWAGVDGGEMVMMLDSCHSAAVPGREFRPGPLGDTGFGQLSYDKGMRILSATQPDKTARATLVQELGHSLLVEALIEEAKAHPRETLAEWLHDTAQQVPALTQRLYPELNDADVQLPELFDFAVTERHQIQSPADIPR